MHSIDKYFYKFRNGHTESFLKLKNKKPINTPEKVQWDLT